MRQLPSILLGTILCASLGLRAQDEPSPHVMGIQARGSAPLAGLSEAVGGARVPGAGLSLFAETEWEDGFKSRLALGGDYWSKGDWTDRPGVEGQVSLLHMDVECVKMLRPDGNMHAGPYFILGLGAYAWSVKTTEGSASTTERVIHLGGSIGFGYCLGRRVEIELRGMSSRLTQHKSAAAVQACINYRF